MEKRVITMKEFLTWQKKWGLSALLRRAQKYESVEDAIEQGLVKEFVREALANEAP